MLQVLRKIRAFINGTFVTGCPRCHKHFYGFHKYGEQVKDNGKHYRLVCHKCLLEIRK